MFVRLPTVVHFPDLIDWGSYGFFDGIMVGVDGDEGHVVLNANTPSLMIMLRNVGSRDFTQWLPQLVIAGSREECERATSGLTINFDMFNGVSRYGGSVLYSVDRSGFVYFPDGDADHEPVERQEITATGRTVYAGDRFYTGIPNSLDARSTAPQQPKKLEAAGALRGAADPDELWARWVWPRWVYSSGKFVPVDTDSSTKYVVGNPQWKLAMQTFTEVVNVVVKDNGTFEKGDYSILSSEGPYTVTKQGSVGYVIGGYGSPDGWWRCSSMTAERDAEFRFEAPPGYEGPSKPNITLAWSKYATDVGGPAAGVYYGEVSMWR